MKLFMDCSSVHTVRVQNVFRASQSTETASTPSAELACRAERMA
jgi:hypothetical protein